MGWSKLWLPEYGPYHTQTQQVNPTQNRPVQGKPNPNEQIDPNPQTSSSPQPKNKQTIPTLIHADQPNPKTTTQKAKRSPFQGSTPVRDIPGIYRSDVLVSSDEASPVMSMGSSKTPSLQILCTILRLWRTGTTWCCARLTGTALSRLQQHVIASHFPHKQLPSRAVDDSKTPTP